MAILDVCDPQIDVAALSLTIGKAQRALDESDPDHDIQSMRRRMCP
jgi:hypothetical protein